MEDNREVKNAREIAIVVAIILVCFIAGIAVHELVLTEKEEKETPATSVYQSDRVDYTKFYNNTDLNNFYNDFGYDDIRILGQDYTIESARNANCYVHSYTGIFNDEILKAFEENKENGISSSIRIVETTASQDLIITDIKYDGEKMKVVRDFTRDRYMNIQDATITYLEYDGVDEYEYNGRRMLVIHNGELTDESFEKDTTNITIFLD